jgi:hypothetical protein
MEAQGKKTYLTGKEGEEFDLETAANWTQNHRHKHPGEIVSHFFGREIIQKILDQEGCMGIRIYHAHDKPLNGRQRATVSLSKFLLKVIGNIEGKRHVIIVGANKEGRDMHPHLEKDGKIIGVSLARTELKEVSGTEHESVYGLVGQVAEPCPGSPNCP